MSLCRSSANPTHANDTQVDDYAEQQTTSSKPADVAGCVLDSSFVTGQFSCDHRATDVIPFNSEAKLTPTSFRNLCYSIAHARSILVAHMNAPSFTSTS